MYGWVGRWVDVWVGGWVGRKQLLLVNNSIPQQTPTNNNKRQQTTINNYERQTNSRVAAGRGR